jgi:hypothetical protein
MSPHEVAGLQGLAMAQGGSLTINPDTGMPEAFNLGGFFSSLLPTLVGGAASMIPGMQFASYPMLTGILAGAATGALTNKDNPLMGAAMGGLGGYSGAGIMGAGKAAGTAMGGAGVGGNTTASTIGGGSSGLATGGGYIPGATSGVDLAYNNALMASQASGATNSAVSGASGALDIEKALAAGKPIGMANTFANTASIAPDPTFLGNMKQAFKGMGGAATGNQAAIDAYTKGIGAESGMGALGKTALPFGGAVLGGLEPSDLYGSPFNADKLKDKYDPYATLNLSNDTGLRLLASGGAIYDSSDNPTPANLSRDGFGVGRLNNLAGEQARSQAETYGYAGGGAIAFAEGGGAEDPTGQDLALPDPTQGIAALPVAQPTEQGPTPDQMAAAATAPSTSGSIIEQVAFKIQQDPNYQPQNPIEAAIVKQLKGTNDMGQGAQDQQGLGSLGPSQPMAPSYAPSVAMGPTYFAGMNAPRGYADGGVVAGEKGMNLNKLPSLNLNFVTNPSESSADREASDYARSPGFVANMGRMTPMADMVSLGARAAQPQPQPTSYALNLNSGKQEAQYAHGGYLDGAGDGMSDSIPATIEGKQPARLADGEFVVPADVVSHIGNGSSKAGSKRLYKMLDKVRHARTGTKKQGREINPNKYLPA